MTKTNIVFVEDILLKYILNIFYSQISKSKYLMILYKIER